MPDNASPSRAISSSALPRLLVLHLALALAACAGDDVADTDTDTGGPGATSATSGETDDPTDPTDTGDTAADPAWSAPYCAPVAPAKWLTPWADFEEQVVEYVNQARKAGYDCGSTGVKPPAPPLVHESRLRCAARAHSADMSERAYFDHTNPDGEDPFDRLAKAGYAFLQAGENIAGGPNTAQGAVEGWLASPGHCANMLDPGYTQIGVGFYEGAGPYTFYWTQTFGKPK
jgi:uncharacterized protein YkwD